jgi:hypothetical protein
MITGVTAITRALCGAPLFVFRPGRGWMPAGPGELQRAQRLPVQALGFYGVFP